MQPLQFQNLVKNAKTFFGLSESKESSTPPVILGDQSQKIAIDKIHFLHLRYYHPSGVLDPHGGATIAYRVCIEEYDIEAGDEPLYFLDVGIANCRFGEKVKDLFCKRIGRDIATARLLKAASEQSPIALWAWHPTHREVITSVKDHYYEMKSVFFPQIRALVK